MPCRKLVVPSSGSTIQRLDGVLALDAAAFLHQQAVSRARLDQLGAQHVLGPPVGLADEVGRPFLGDLQMLDLAEVADEAARGLLGRRRHDVQQCRAVSHE